MVFKPLIGEIVESVKTVISFHLMIILYESIKSYVVLKKWLALEMALGIKSKIQKDD